MAVAVQERTPLIEVGQRVKVEGFGSDIEGQVVQLPGVIEGTAFPPGASTDCYHVAPHPDPETGILGPIKVIEFSAIGNSALLTVC